MGIGAGHYCIRKHRTNSYRSITCLVIYEFRIYYSVVNLSGVVGLHMVLGFGTMSVEVTTYRPVGFSSKQPKGDGSIGTVKGREDRRPDWSWFTPGSNEPPRALIAGNQSKTHR